jgi:hypothetical protein
MRRCLLRLALVPAAIALVASAALAESTSGGLRVSVTVARTCRVSTDTPSVRIDCGTRVQPVQITGPSAGIPSKTASSGPALTIEF